jgi:hypothetical protein
VTPFLKKSAVEDPSEGGGGTATREWTPIGELLVNAGLLDRSQLDEAVNEGGESGERVGEVIVRRGWATEDDVARVLAKQCELDYLDRASIWFDADALTRLSPDDARRLQALPLRIEGDKVMVAVAEPTDERLEELHAVIGDDALVVVVPKTALDRGIDLLESRGQAAEGQPAVAEEPAAPPPPKNPPKASPAPPPPAPPKPAAAPPAPPKAPLNGKAADLASQARSFADSIAAQADTMQEYETRIQTLEAELAAGRAAMQEAKQQIAVVAQLLDRP